MSKEEDPQARQERLRRAGAWLRAQREARGLSGSDLAKQLDVNQVRVSAYERGQYEVPTPVADALANVLNLPLLEIRRELGLWVPADTDLTAFQRYINPAHLTDDALINELVRRARERGEREIADVFPRRSNVPGELWDSLIANALSEITLGGYTNYFFWTERPNFSATLRDKVNAGVRVRILLGDPHGQVTRDRDQIENAPLALGTRIGITLDELNKLGPLPGIEVRFSQRNAQAHVSRSIFRFDDQALVCEHIAEQLGHGSLTFHVRRLHHDGPFDQYVAHLEHLWDGGRTLQPNDFKHNNQ